MLESRSRLLFILLAIGIVVSVSVTFWNTMVRGDFVIINDVDESEMVSDFESP